MLFNCYYRVDFKLVYVVAIVAKSVFRILFACPVDGGAEDSFLGLVGAGLGGA